MDFKKHYQLLRSAIIATKHNIKLNHLRCLADKLRLENMPDMLELRLRDKILSVSSRINNMGKVEFIVSYTDFLTIHGGYVSLNTQKTKLYSAISRVHRTTDERLLYPLYLEGISRLLHLEMLQEAIETGLLQASLIQQYLKKSPICCIAPVDASRDQIFYGQIVSSQEPYILMACPISNIHLMYLHLIDNTSGWDGKGQWVNSGNAIAYQQGIPNIINIEPYDELKKDIEEVSKIYGLLPSQIIEGNLDLVLHHKISHLKDEKLATEIL